MQAYEQSLMPSESGIAQAPWLRVVVAVLTKQLGAELYGMPGYGLTLKGRVPDGFIAAPHDMRPADPALGRAILSGRFALGGGRMSVQGSGDPWNRPSPTRAFALELHRFAWLPAVLSQGDAGAREALRLFGLWQQTFRKWTPFAWGEAVVARRLINLSVAARRLSAIGAPADVAQLAQSMAEQGRHLLRLHEEEYAAEKAVALVALGCALAGPTGDRFRAKGLKRLPRALKKAVMIDGSHASRSAEQGLDLLYDLLMVEDGLNQRGLPVPETVSQHIDRLTRFVRVLSHPDGSLCGFQGSEGVGAGRVTPALVHDDSRPHGQTATPNLLDHGRYHRLVGRSLHVVVDSGEPRQGAMGFAACDYPMAFEASGGRDKLIVSPGWSPNQSDRQDMRVVREGNTLSIGEKPLLAPVGGKFGELLNYTLEGDRYKVRSRRVDAEDSGTLLEMEHEGWREQYGVKHERRLYVDTQRDELRGEDRLTPVEAKLDKVTTGPFIIAFRLHPEVQASMARDKKSVLLRGPGGRGWWFRHDAREVALTHGVIFEGGLTRKTTMIELKGVCRPDVASRVRWKLSPAES